MKNIQYGIKNRFLRYLLKTIVSIFILMLITMIGLAYQAETGQQYTRLNGFWLVMICLLIYLFIASKWANSRIWGKDLTKKGPQN